MMTKEKLYKQLCECGITDGSPLACAVRHELSKFFDSNVCIPKGATLQAKFDGVWTDVFTNNDEDVLRIEPSEPVWEYQWLVIHHQAYVVSDYGIFMTLEETCDGMIPIEETKRVRQ